MVEARWGFVLLVLVGCDKKEDAPAPAPVATAAEAPAPPPVPPCDGEAAWGEGFPENGDDDALTAHGRAYAAKIQAWTPDCRQKALVTVCQYGCESGEDGLSDELINAFPAPERTAALKYRVDRNTAKATKWRDLFTKTKALVDHALAIQGSARSSAYETPNATAEQLAAELVNGDPCMRRMKADDAKIDPIEKDLESEGTMILLKAPIFGPLEGLLNNAHACWNCSDDRWGCKDLKADLKTAETDLVTFEKQVAADKKQLAGASP
jgi:hypothetical protein